MRILLDTHVLIWYMEGDKSLKQQHRHLIINPANEIFVSVTTLWEITIKVNMGRLKTSGSLTEVITQLGRQSIELLPILPGHVLQSAALPFHHRDPFDRMLVAQSQVEFMSIMSYDPSFQPYGVRLV